MASFHVNPSKQAVRPGRVKFIWTGSNPHSARATPVFSNPSKFQPISDGFKPALSKGYTRPQSLDVLQTSASFGRHDLSAPVN